MLDYQNKAIVCYDKQLSLLQLFGQWARHVFILVRIVHTLAKALSFSLTLGSHRNYEISKPSKNPSKLNIFEKFFTKMIDFTVINCLPLMLLTRLQMYSEHNI